MNDNPANITLHEPPANTATEPKLAAPAQGDGMLIIQVTWKGKRPGSGWLQFDASGYWPSGCGLQPTQQKVYATQWRRDYWDEKNNKGYLGMWHNASSSWSWLSWNNGPEFPRVGLNAQVRVWASAVEWQLQDGLLVPVGLWDQRLAICSGCQACTIITLRPEDEPLTCTIEYL